MGAISFTPPAGGSSFDPANPGAIGATTPSTVNATRLTVAQGALTDPVTGLNLTATWNDAADTFHLDDADVTDTASAASSTLLRRRVGGSDRFRVTKAGTIEVKNRLGFIDYAGASIGLNGLGLDFFTQGQRFCGIKDGSGGGFAVSMAHGYAFSGHPDQWSLAALDLFLKRSEAGILRITADTGTAGAALEGFERTAPSAPAANGYRIYAEDDGSGKTRLMVRFATGAAQQIAIEP